MVHSLTACLYVNVWPTYPIMHRTLLQLKKNITEKYTVEILHTVVVLILYWSRRCLFSTLVGVLILTIASAMFTVTLESGIRCVHGVQPHTCLIARAKGKLFKECKTCPVSYNDLNPQSQKRQAHLDRFFKKIVREYICDGFSRSEYKRNLIYYFVCNASV